jgi:hypothetical protein
MRCAGAYRDRMISDLNAGAAGAGATVRLKNENVCDLAERVASNVPRLLVAITLAELGVIERPDRDVMCHAVSALQPGIAAAVCSLECFSNRATRSMSQTFCCAGDLGEI